MLIIGLFSLVDERMVDCIYINKRGQMNTHLKALTSLMLATALVAGQAQTATSGTTSTSAKATTKKKAAPKKPAKPSVESQIEQLRIDMQNQIQGLKQQLADRDQQLQQAQQAAAAAQAAAAQAQQAAQSNQQALTENNQAVSSLQGAVTDLKTNSTSLVTTIQEDQAKVKAAIENPTALHYKGVTLTPGGFMAGETVWRNHGTAADIPTPFSAIPYENATSYHLSEFYGSARQSRLSLMTEGKVDFGTLRGYVEADFLGTGTTSNDNQSNSYLLRQRVVWAQTVLNNGFSFTGGQMWSLATAQKKGIDTISGNVATPQTIDPNYLPGFVWTRQFGFRAVKSYQKFAVGISMENPQLIYSTSLAADTPYAVLGSAGANGGNYNAAVSNCATAVLTANLTTGVGTPTTTCSYLATLPFNYAPDIILKAAFDPGFGHYEVFGLGRFAHEEVYPGENTTAYLYGGVKGTGPGTPVSPIPKPTPVGGYNNKIALGGIGGSALLPVTKTFSIGISALYGPGVGRYGDSTLPDVTANTAGEFAPIHNFSGLGTVEWNVTPRLVLYANYGGDYASRAAYAGFATTPTYSAATNTWTTATKAAAQGYGSKLASTSACGAEQPSGYQGSSTGYYTSGGCGLNTRDVQEITGGYWYDFYRGPKGRLRQGFQYAYAVRQSWSGAPLTGTNLFQIKGNEGMFWTSFRYYLP
jgi:hypothetical protein